MARARFGRTRSRQALRSARSAVPVDAGLAGDRVAVAPHRDGQGAAHQADIAAEQCAIDLLADAAAVRVSQRAGRAELLGDRQ